LQYSKPNLPRNPDWEGYGKTTKNIFGVGRDQRLARQISWTLPGGFGQAAISVSIAEISKRSSARATTIYSSAAISRRSGLAPGANSIAMTLGRPLASPGFAGGHVPVGPRHRGGLSRPGPGNRMSTSLRQLQPCRHLRGPGNTSAAERSYFRSGGVVVIAQIRRVLFSCEIFAAVSGLTIALS